MEGESGKDVSYKMKDEKFTQKFREKNWMVIYKV
jgi:hypothetical protein